MTRALTPDIWTLMLNTAQGSVDATLDELTETASFSSGALGPIKDRLFYLEAAGWITGAEPLAEAIAKIRLLTRVLADTPAELKNALIETLRLIRALVVEMASKDPDDAEMLELLTRIDDVAESWRERGTPFEDTGPELPAAKTPSIAADAADKPADIWVPEVDENMVGPFVEECSERLKNLSEKLVDLEQSPEDTDLLASIFRDLHTIKGSSAFVGLSPLNRVAHRAEDLVGALRDGKKQADGAVIDVLLAATDTMNEILNRATHRTSMADLTLEPILERLDNPASSPPQRNLDRAENKEKKQPPTLATKSRPPVHQRATLRVDFAKMDVLLNLVGELVLDRTAIHGVLENLESAVRALETSRRALGRKRKPLGKRGLSRKLQPLAARNSLLEIHEEVDRVERIFRQLSRELDVASGSLDFVAGELRDQVMKLRMVPIAQIFSKHRRTVRDLCRSLNKKVRLVLEGQETELDKMLVEKLDEPLLHMVRNAIDHGIESPAQREAAGKPTEGTVKLAARHQGGQLILEITDDGKGLDPAAIRKKAIDKGILSPEKGNELGDHDSLRLIFAPGFSTAEKVTTLSGRGVGMDVVHETMRKLRGSADVQSVQGQGSTFTLALPLTLAIRQVLLLRVQGEMLALPLDNVERTVEVGLHQLNDVADRQILEGPHGPFPLIQLDCVLGGATPQVHHTANRHVICVEVHGNRYGLVCDGLEGKQEIVVKSLGDILVNVPCAAGATLVGEKVVIILDLPALIARWKGEVTSQPHAVESPRQDLARFKVLIVEDSAPTRALLSDLYRQLGFAVTEATDGEQALALAQEKPFDLVSTDARMPHMDGYTLARRLRKNPLSKHTPILMISARGERVDKVRGFDAGVDGYLVKPIDAAKLADVVSRLIDQQKPTAEQENTP